MRPVLSSLLALVLGAACAALVACGGGGDDAALIPAGSADEMLQQLDRVERSVRNGDCEAVDGDVARLQEAVDGLPNRVDADLRDRLTEGVANLAEIAPDECLDETQTTDTTETTETVVPETTTETTPTETTDTTETTPPDTTETEPPTTTEPEPPPTTTPPTETIPESGGGATIPPGDASGGDAGSAVGGSGGSAGTGGATPTP